ncbi:hypothetical protein ACFVTJ_03135 [Agrobacterium sp. NPDC058088]|uniref:hypothetical protein n=1 Tax=Agrobacterium sp. NPDC058088 TaxID=3346335 RepID=UPI0036D9BD4B
MNYSKAFSSLASFTAKRVGLKSNNRTGGPIFAFLLIALAGCGVDSPDRLRGDIPDGIPAGETVYYNNRWFECAVAIYKLDSVFMDEVRRNGLLSLNKATSTPWAEAPVLEANYAMDRRIADFVSSLDCIKDKKLQTLFERTSANGGYFQVQLTNSITLIAPDEGLVMVGGYE